MKALVLGGSGFFGSATARRLAQGAVFDQIILASRDASKVEPLAQELGAGARGMELDIFDEAALATAVQSVDIVVNAAGAALETAVPAMRACAAAGKPYCDLSAEAGVLLKAESIEDELNSSKATILIGAGFHPGVTDLLGASAVAALDDLHSLDFYIVGNFPDYGDATSMVAAFDAGWGGTEGMKTILAGAGLSAMIVKDGERISVDPWCESHAMKTPDGFDIDFTWFATLEPLAAHRRHTDAKHIAMHYGAWPGAVNSVLGNSARAALLGEIKPGAALREVFAAAQGEIAAQPRVHFWAEAGGVKDGRQTRCRVFSKAPWATNASMIATTTGVLCYAAERLAKGEISKRGLVTAADVLQPQEVYSYLAGGDETGLMIEIDAL